MGALITEALAAGPAVVLGELDAELLPAAVAVQDLVVGHPVRGPGRILYQTCGEEGTMLGGTRGTQHPHSHGARRRPQTLQRLPMQLHTESLRDPLNRQCLVFTHSTPATIFRAGAQELECVYQ